MCLSVKTDNYFLDFLEIFVDRPPHPHLFFLFVCPLKSFSRRENIKGLFKG